MGSSSSRGLKPILTKKGLPHTLLACDVHRPWVQVSRNLLNSGSKIKSKFTRVEPDIGSVRSWRFMEKIKSLAFRELSNVYDRISWQGNCWCWRKDDAGKMVRMVMIKPVTWTRLETLDKPHALGYRTICYRHLDLSRKKDKRRREATYSDILMMSPLPSVDQSSTYRVFGEPGI